VSEAGGVQGPVGSMTPFFLSVSLIIRHTPEVHDQVSTRLRQLRRLPLIGQRFKQGQAVPPSASPAGATKTPGGLLGPAETGPRADRIRRMLDELNREVEGLLRESGRATPNG